MSLSSTITPRLTLSRAITSLPTLEYFGALGPRAMSLAAYRRLFRLRHLVENHDYTTILRRRFTRIDFNIRRQKVLGVLLPLSHQDMTTRLANTVAFIFNSTCHSKDERLPVYFYDDLVRETRPRLEREILSTILNMDRQMPPTLKYDYSYDWVDDVKLFYAEVGSGPDRRNINRLFKTQQAPYLGFLQYEQCVMLLNESMNLCI